MGRTNRPPKKSDAMVSNGETEALTALASLMSSRAGLSDALGLSFGGERDLYKVLGYKRVLVYQDYFNQYSRGDIAKRIIDAPVNVTWKGIPKVTDNQEEESEFDKAWNELSEELKIWNRFTRVDKLTGLGRFGILMLGFNDVTSEDGFKTEVQKGDSLALLYTQPYGEGSVSIKTWNSDVTNERYGMPNTYEITLGNDEQADTSTTATSKTIEVHWSRVLHIVDDRNESDVYGTPRLKAIFNRLQDLQKVAGGSGEMFWKGARPGYQAVVDKEYTADNQSLKEVGEQLDEYENNLRRTLRLRGVKMEGLETQVSDPTAHVDTQLKLISASKGFPMRILTGSERGELASTQDDTHWRELIEERRADFAEPMILRAFIDRLLDLELLPDPIEGYDIEWPDLHTVSDKDEADVGKIRTEALAKYSSSPGAELIMPPEIFLEFIMKLSPDQIERITKAVETMEKEEAKDIDESVIEPEEEPESIEGEEQ